MQERLGSRRNLDEPSIWVNQKTGASPETSTWNTNFCYQKTQNNIKQTSRKSRTCLYVTAEWFDAAKNHTESATSNIKGNSDGRGMMDRVSFTWWCRQNSLHKRRWNIHWNYCTWGIKLTRKQTRKVEDRNVDFFSRKTQTERPSWFWGWYENDKVLVCHHPVAAKGCGLVCPLRYARPREKRCE